MKKIMFLLVAISMVGVSALCLYTFVQRNLNWTLQHEVLEWGVTPLGFSTLVIVPTAFILIAQIRWITHYAG